MSTEPLRRVLFPTPRKSDDGTSSRSIQRIRPKPEVTPVNLQSTPTTFKQLVENSPVPLAVAAANAAMRVAESAQNGRPIMTEMTRAAEEVVKNSDYNAVRPPHLSPRPLPLPPRKHNIPAKPSSTLLPPITSPSTRPAGALSTFRTMFMRQQQARSWSSTPVPNDYNLRKADEHDGKQHREELKPPPSPIHVPKMRVPPFRQPDFISTSSGKRILKPVTVPGKQPRSRVKYDPLNLLFGSSSPLPIASTAETGTISDDGHIEDHKKMTSLSKTVESSGKQPKKRPRTLAKIEPGTIIPDDELNESPAMRTRSAKRSRRASKTSNADNSRDTRPRKRRRMSEVLKLQKALETAAWTNSVDIEKQTEVIVISDCSPDRPHTDASIKFENKTTHDKGKVRKAGPTKARRKISGSMKESKPEKTARSNEIRQNVITKERSNTISRSLGKRTVNATRRKAASAKRLVNKQRGVQSKDRTADGSLEEVKQNMGRKGAREKKKSRLRRIEGVTATEKYREREKAIAGKTAEASGAALSTDTRIPLKKRLSPEKKKDISPAKVVTNISLPCADGKQEKMPRKSPNPKRLGAATKDTNEPGMICEKSKETTSTKAASPETSSLDPACPGPTSVDGLCPKETATEAVQPEKPAPERASLEKRLPETTDSEATLSEAARPRDMEYKF